MNRVDLITAITAQAGLTKKDADKVLGIVLDTIKDGVQHGETVQLVGFGSFKPVKKKARKCRNPKTGEAIKVPAKTVVKFSVGKAFADQAASQKKPRKK